MSPQSGLDPVDLSRCPAACRMAGFANTTLPASRLNSETSSGVRFEVLKLAFVCSPTLRRTLGPPLSIFEYRSAMSCTGCLIVGSARDEGDARLGAWRFRRTVRRRQKIGSRTGPVVLESDATRVEYRRGWPSSGLVQGISADRSHIGPLATAV